MYKKLAALGSGVFLIIIVLFFQLFSVAIYANFIEKKEYRFTTYNLPTIYFQNNNFLSTISFNPLFYGSVKIVNTTGSMECFYDISKDEPCDKYNKDLKKIESGNSFPLSFYLYPNGNNFTIKATSYLNLVNYGFELTSESWNCERIDVEYYWCTSST